MRAAKARKRMARLPEEAVAKQLPDYALEIGVRVKRTGEMGWFDFRSVRDAARRLAMVRRFYEVYDTRRINRELAGPGRRTGKAGVRVGPGSPALQGRRGSEQ